MRRSAKIKKAVQLNELGNTGLKVYGGSISEEFSTKLSGRKWLQIYAEMADNDATVGAFLFAIDMLYRNVKWEVKPKDESEQAKEQAEFVTQCMNDMEHTWQEFISEVLSMLIYGFAPMEKVYKIRKGLDTSDKRYFSKFNDGKVGWRKLPIRSQDTLWAWDIDDYGDLVAMKQQPYIHREGTDSIVTIPKEKLLLFRTVSRKNSPQGKSVLRNAYRSWFFKKRIEEIEGIGIERDLAGLPIAWAPANILNATTAEEIVTLNSLKKVVSNIKRDSQEGVVFPLVYDENGKKLYDLTLLSTGGQRQFNTTQIIDRYDKRIAMTVLADFLFLGQSKIGSFALSSDKTAMFGMVLGAWLKDIAGVLNNDAIPSLMRINNVPPELWPYFEPGDVEKEDISIFTDALYKLIGVGALLPDEGVDAKIRQLLEIKPTNSDGRTVVPMDFVEQKLEAGKASNVDNGGIAPTNQDTQGAAKPTSRDKGKK